MRPVSGMRGTDTNDMSSKLIYLLLASSCFGQVVSIEKRGAADWPTRNHLRRAVTVDAPRSVPVLMTEELPADFNPDSVRVIGPGSGEIVRCKVEWKVPEAGVSFISRGAGTYYIYFDVRGAGETERVTSPAMVGTGDAITYGRAGAKAKLSVGLWAHPAVIDFDGDGNLDLVVACVSGSYNGIYLFRNLGTNERPLFDRAEWLGQRQARTGRRRFQRRRRHRPGGERRILQRRAQERPLRLCAGQASAQLLDRPRRLLVPGRLGRRRQDRRARRRQRLARLRLGRCFQCARANGRAAHSTATSISIATSAPTPNRSMLDPVLLQADGKPIDQYGSPVPNPVDWLGAGKLDLLASDFRRHHHAVPQPRHAHRAAARPGGTAARRRPAAAHGPLHDPAARGVLAYGRTAVAGGRRRGRARGVDRESGAARPGA